MLNISLSGMLWTVVNLIVLYLLLRKFLWRPVTNVIESRQEEISHNLTAAADQRAQAESSRRKYDDQLAQASKDADDVMRKAKERGNQEYQAIVESAQEQARTLTEKTQAQLEADRAEMLAGARKEVAALALLAAAKVSGRRMNGEDDRALVDAFLSEEGDNT